MKNKIFIFFLLFSISNYTCAISENFTFLTSEIKISNNGNIINANDGTAFLKARNMEIEAKKFQYNKKNGILDALTGIVKLLNEDIEIKAKIITYNQNLNELNATGNVEIKDKKNKLLIKSENIFFNSINKNIETKSFSTIEDNDGNLFSSDEFFYSASDNFIRFNDVKLTDKQKNIYDIQNAYLNLDINKILGQDFSAQFADGQSSEASYPRLRGLAFSHKDDISVVSKGVFTTCKKNDSCPPWQMNAKKITHNKKKKTLYYDSAWLKLYDVPVFYFPKFFHPDPTVKRQSGFLMPSLTSSTNLGSAFNTPYYHVIADNRDVTLKPRFYSNQKTLLQAEYREVNANTEYSIDFGSTINDDKSSKAHFFSKLNRSIDLLNFEETELILNLEQTTDDTYLKTYKIKSPLIQNKSTLSTSLEIDAYREDLYFNANVKSIEDLSKKRSDRFEFIYPSYTIEKELNNIDFLDGNYVLNSNGYIKNYQTNIFEKIIVNDLHFDSSQNIMKNGLKNNYNILIKNVNTDSKNSLKYKERKNYTMASIFQYNLSYPLKKSNKNSNSILNPLASIKFSPNKNKDARGKSRRIDAGNIFNLNRLGNQDSVEGGTSLTYGIEYLKNNKMNNPILKGSIANVARLSKDKNLPSESKLGDKNSDIVGTLNYIPNHILKFNYDFSLDNNFTDTNYQLLGAEIKVNNFVTSFEYLNDNNSQNQDSFYTSKSSLSIDDSKNIIFETRRNQKTNITEFYNLIYQYRNDCLIAALEYNKDYYEDSDLKPEENIFFKLTIVPFGQTSSPNLKKIK